MPAVLARLGDWKDRAVPPLPRLSRGQRLWLLGIVAAAAALRIAWGLYAATQPVSFRDPAAYMLIGDMLSGGHGYSYLIPEGSGVPPGVYPTAYYPPGYPLFLGGLFWLADLLPFDVSHLGVAVGANVVVSILTVPLVFALGRRLNGVTAGLVAAGAMALLPNAVFHTGVALTESLFLLLLVGMLLLAVATPALARRPGWRRLVAIGGLFALSALVRPVSLVLLPAFLFLWWPAGAWAALRRTAIVLGSALLVILPWTVRNVVTMDSPILISANLGDNLCIGYNEDATGGFVQLPARCNEHVDVPRPRFEVVRQSDNIGHSLDFARENPTRLPSLVFWRGYYTFNDDHDGLAAVQDYGDVPWMRARTERLLAFAADGFYFALMGFAAVGVVAGLRRRGRHAGARAEGEAEAAAPGRDRRQSFLLVTMLLSIVPPLLTFGDPRFKAPLYPLLAVFGAVALVAAWHARPAPEVVPAAGEPGDGTAAAGDAPADGAGGAGGAGGADASDAGGERDGEVDGSRPEASVVASSSPTQE